MIRKSSGGYRVYNKSGNKSLSKVYKTKAEANHRLRQIEWFKHHPSGAVKKKR